MFRSLTLGLASFAVTVLLIAAQTPAGTLG